ncbi:2OG-Fe(II) oxygenase [Burkholderia sp. TSV86]|uniref:2OG-Fe(II) oxygenase n=1 Tax=Burkholderia sp. TSV86 TaxID=1385594 RepID=UPI0007578F6F|nr:2OG-Fe(II) oxygenase [Burkholderia sp. TSV86]KVE31730.1 hypothetical protein WS68_16730 [Burkholderia sp. TSV86]
MNLDTRPSASDIWQDITIIDDLLPRDEQAAVQQFLSDGPWHHGWRSHNGAGAEPFWNRHFAGSRDPARLTGHHDASDELAARAPLLHACWQHIAQSYLPRHALQSCYANGLPYGTDGAVHTDSLEIGACTAVYYPHEHWNPDWGGETVFFNKDRTDILAAIYPKPNRLLVFPGFVYHVARGVSRTCPTMRITLMFKTQISTINSCGDSSTKTR